MRLSKFHWIYFYNFLRQINCIYMLIIIINITNGNKIVNKMPNLLRILQKKFCLEKKQKIEFLT